MSIRANYPPPIHGEHLVLRPWDRNLVAQMARWGERGVVELAGVIGYYTMVSMTLNAHEIPLPDGASAPLALPPDGGLSALPACRLAKPA